MLRHWLDDNEAFAAISQDQAARRIFLRMSAMSRIGSLPRFLEEVARERGLDEETKSQVAELAQDTSFLLAVEEYLLRTEFVH